MHDNLKPDLAALPPDHRRYVESVITERDSYRRVAEAKTVSVAVNGKNPRHWSMERWGAVVSVGSAGMLVAGMVWAFNSYHEYRTALTTVHSIAQAMPTVTQAVSDMVTRIAVMESEHGGMRRDIDAVYGRQPRVGTMPARRPVPRPAFPLDEQFVLPEGQ